jgi:hypothetical protein
METEIIDRSKFIDLLSNFTFWIYFHEEKNPTGKRVWNTKSGTWAFNESKDYWDFFIQINSHHTDYIIENWYKNNYWEFLKNFLEDFIKQNESSLLLAMSHSECFDMLNQELVKLDHIQKQFHTKTFIDDDNSGTPYGLLWHRNINLEIADDEKEKRYKENGDRFFNEQISFYLSKQKEVIEFTISFLSKKIQWLELKQEYNSSSVDVKSIEAYFERISAPSRNFSNNSQTKYFSFERDTSKLTAKNSEGISKLIDENSDYIRSFLFDNKFIEDIDYRDFRRLFKNETLMRPIVWISKESVLYYFIKTLVEKGIILDHHNHWIITSLCFVIKEEGITRKIIPTRIERLKPPKRNFDCREFDEVFNFIKS